jgi:hypothetical protein
MSGLFIQIKLGDVWCTDMQVSPAKLLVDDEPLKFSADSRTLRKPERQTLPDSIGKGKELKLSPDPLMIPTVAFIFVFIVRFIHDLYTTTFNSL